MNAPLLKTLFRSLVVLLLSPIDGQVISGVVKLQAEVQQGVTLVWTWAPSTNEMGGLSTNDYATNVWFQLVATTNITMPMTNWTVVIDHVPASPWQTQYNAQIGLPSNGAPQFYAGRTMTLRDVSPFSNVAPYVHAGGQFILSIGQ